MKLKFVKHFVLLTVSLVFCFSSRAQMTATWTAGGGDADWNNTLNWDIGTPMEGTNALIGAAVVVDYNAPMAATSFAGVNNGGVLNVNAAGFNIDAGGLAAYTGAAASSLRIAAGGVFVATNSGNIAMATGSDITVQGGVFIVTNSTGTFSLGVNGNNAGAGFTNNNGTVILSQPFQSRGASTRFVNNGGSVTMSSSGTNGIFEGSNDQNRQFLINGGTVNLGNFLLTRTGNGVSAAGLVVSNGTVTATMMSIGTGASAAGTTIAGGVLTNTGAFTIADRVNAANSGQRRVFFYVRGGSVYSTDPSGIIIAPQANATLAAATVYGGFLDIASGLVVAEKLTLVGPNAVTNAHATLTLSGTGALYLGAGGLVGNTGFSNTSFTVSLNGGTLGAKDGFSINANGTLGGAFTVNAADLGGSPRNITNLAVWSGSGSLTKTGGGTLLLAANNTYSGNTVVNGGVLALGANGSFSNSPTITLTNNGILDVSAKVGASLVGNQVLSGQGAVVGSLSAGPGRTLRPGGNGVAGTLTFSNALIQTGGVLNSFDLSTNPNSGNDFIEIAGDLDLSGTNTIQISTLNGPLPSSTTYTLIHYSGSLVAGGVTNLSLSGAVGTLVHDPFAKTISLVISGGIRAPTAVTWIGSAGNSNWDMLVSSNWLNGSSRDYFVVGDAATFDDTGATNPLISIVGSVLPGSTFVNSSSNYTFAGSGTVDGSGGLTKTNSGTLSIQTTNNNYPGATIIGAGVVEAAKIANGGGGSSIGSSGADPSNLQIFDGTLRYTGGTASSDRGVMLNGNAGIDIAANTLTVSGNLVGTGSLTKAGAGTLILSSAASTYGGATTISNGVLQINAQTALGTNAVNLAGGTLFLNIGGQPTYNLPLNVLAPSGLNVGGNNTINLATLWTGSSTLNVNVNSGGFFTFNSEIPNFTGTLAFGTSAGLFRFNSGGNANGAQQATGSTNILFDLGTSTLALINRNGGGASFGNYFLGGLAGGPATQVRGSEGSSSASTYHIGDKGLDTTFSGSIRNGLGGGGALTHIVKVGAGTLTLAGTNLHTGTTTVSNGVLALSGIGTLQASTSIVVVSNTVLDVSQRTDGTLTLASGQTLQGGGTIRGSVTAQNGAAIIVGDDVVVPGSMVITNVLTLQSGSTITMDLDHGQILGGRTNDVIEGLASVSYGGTLTLTVTSIETNSVFKLFNAGSYSGGFEAINPATPPLFPAVWAWDTSKLTVDGTLRITALRPSIGSIDASTIASGFITLNGTGGAPGGPFTVLSSTNVALPVINWTAAATGNFDGSGNIVAFQVPVDPAGTQQYFLIRAD